MHTPHPPHYNTARTLGILFGSVAGGLVLLAAIAAAFMLITYLRAPHRQVNAIHFRSSALDAGPPPESMQRLLAADM